MITRKKAALAVAPTLIAVTLAAGHANAATNAPHHHATAYQRTCTAFAAWERHPSTARLATLAYWSTFAPWQPLGLDASLLIYDERSDPRSLDLPTDKHDVAHDCHL